MTETSQQDFASLIPKNDENEEKFISYIIKNPLEHNLVEFHEIEHNYICAMIYGAILQCIQQGWKADIDTLFTICKQQDEEFKKSDIISLSRKYSDFTNIETVVVESIKAQYQKKLILSNIQKFFENAISTNKFDPTNLNALSLGLQDAILYTGKAGDLLSTADLAEFYRNILEERKIGMRQRSLGFAALDKIVFRPAQGGEMTGIIAMKGTGKSIFTKTIENLLINRGVCVISFNLEMIKESTMDRLVCIRTGFKPEELMVKDMPEETRRMILSSLKHFENLKNYRYYPEADLTMSSLDSYIYKAKTYFKKQGVLPDDEYCVVTIDSLEIMSEFDNAKPEKIKANVNRLHRIARKHNVHLIILLQSNENKYRQGKIIKKPEELNYYKVDLTDIEGGSAYGARCRVVLSLNRPLYLKRQFFQERKEEWDLEIDYTNVNIVKQNDGKLDHCCFVFGDNYRFYPYIKPEDAKNESANT